MPIRVNCPACGSVINAPDKAAGRTGKCPKCGQGVAIPALPSSPLPAAPGATTKPELPASPPPAAPGFDVEIEDDFDVEVEEPPVRVAQAMPVQPRSPSPAPIVVASSNPFESFGPPADSVAGKLSLNFDEPAESVDQPEAPTASPKWNDVVAGLGWLNTSVLVSFAATLVIVGTNGLLVSTGKLGIAVFVGLGLGVLLAIVTIGFLILGLVNCFKTPEPAEGGPGPQLAKFAFYAALATALLAPCGVGILTALAMPILIGLYLRAIGTSLPSPAVRSAATLYLIGVGVALFTSLVVAVVPFILNPILLDARASRATFLATNLGVLGCGGLVQLSSLVLYLLAIGKTRAEIIRVKKLRRR